MKKGESKVVIPAERIENSIYFIRGHKVMLDQDLATFYNVPTKRFNEQVRRNIDRFPKDFAFQLTKKEWENLKSQFATSSWGGRRKLPIAFTEHGVLMASNVLKSARAIVVSIEIMRTFIKMRQVLASHKELTKELQEVKEFVLKNSNKTDREFRRVWQTIEKLTEKPKENEHKMGFKLN